MYFHCTSPFCKIRFWKRTKDTRGRVKLIDRKRSWESWIQKNCILFLNLKCFFVCIFSGAYRLPCLLVDNFVSLSCKISENIKTLSLIDDNGNATARCTLQGSSSNCLFKDFVKPVIGDKVVIFYLHRNLTTNIDRNWFCSQENITFRPEILSSKGKSVIT